jgi:hypothetical protein
MHCPCCDLTDCFAPDSTEPITRQVFSARRFLGHAILRNRDGYVERLKKGPSLVDVGASLLKTVEERPSGGGEGGVEFVARIVSPDFEDGRLLVRRLVGQNVGPLGLRSVAGNRRCRDMSRTA